MVTVVDKYALILATQNLLKLLGYSTELPKSVEVVTIAVQPNGQFALAVAPFGPIVEDSIN